MPSAVLLVLLLALLAAPIVLAVGALRPRWAIPVAVALAALTFAAVLWGWAAGGGQIDVPWAPTWQLRLHFVLDGLAALFAVLATGIGTLVLVFSIRYMRDHLEHQERLPGELVRFAAFMLLFLGAMVGLVMAQDLLLIFLFWDLTAVASYYLIAYDRQSITARRAALMAFLVTGISSVLFLIGALRLFERHGTFALPTLIENAQPDVVLTTALALMVIAALAKSAQVPFHFWLPRAMAAPTPVSAYLHSAAMVAAGVFLLARLYPLLQLSRLLLDALLVIGWLSIAVGGVLALVQDRLKRVLAYSTVSQYGYVVFMFGLGGDAGAAGAVFYVLAHALLKSALFLTAGAVTESTGEERLSRLGGLARAQPALAMTSAVAAAGLAAVPLTIGFFKDELLFRAAVERGPVFAGLAAAGAALTVAYMWRFWSGIFLGQRQAESHAVPAGMSLPIAVLALLALAGGIVVEPFARLAAAGAADTVQEPVSMDLAYHLDARPENLLAATAFAGGALLVVARGAWANLAMGLARLGEQVGPQQWYRVGLAVSNSISRQLYGIELRDIGNRVATILVPTAILVGAGLVATAPSSAFDVGRLPVDDLPLALALVITMLSTVLVTVPRGHLTLVLALASVSYALAAVYALFGAPDLALVAVLVSTLFSLLFLAVLSLIPHRILHQVGTTQPDRTTTRREVVLAGVAGLFALAVAWGVLSRPAAISNPAASYIELAQQAHAHDVVTAILVDFRGLATLAEVTVVGVAAIGIMGLLRQWRRQ